MKYFSFVFLLAIFFLLINCDHESGNTSYNYGTQSDSARYYFFKGWEEIMDNGRWTESEQAFRKAVDFDPNWLLGKSLLGRITRNLEERERLLQEIESGRDNAGDDEKLLLEVNLLSMKAMNNRDRGIMNTEAFTKDRRKLGETNFGRFVRKYPEDDYFKAEYIEILQANHGTKVALDTLYTIASADQMKLGFYISYLASLELELGNFQKAIALSKELNNRYTNSSFTSPLMLKAAIYQAQDSLQQAKSIVDRVVELDSNHIIALSTQAQINRELNSKN